jgi:hypothetical protein
VERRPAAVDRVDPREVLFDQRSRCLRARLDALLQVGNSGLFQIERRTRGRLRAGGCEQDAEQTADVNALLARLTCSTADPSG